MATQHHQASEPQQTGGNPNGQTPKAFKHGTLTGYAANKCRCDPCRENWNDYYRRYRARRA